MMNDWLYLDRAARILKAGDKLTAARKAAWQDGDWQTERQLAAWQEQLLEMGDQLARLAVSTKTSRARAAARDMSEGSEIE